MVRHIGLWNVQLTFGRFLGSRVAFNPTGFKHNFSHFLLSHLKLSCADFYPSPLRPLSLRTTSSLLPLVEGSEGHRIGGMIMIISFFLSFPPSCNLQVQKFIHQFVAYLAPHNRNSQQLIFVARNQPPVTAVLPADHHYSGPVRVLGETPTKFQKERGKVVHAAPLSLR